MYDTFAVVVVPAGNNEAFEPYTSNIYCRRVLSGEFFVVNPHLLKDLLERGLWTEQVKQQLIAHNGSVQLIPEIPDDLKELYRTVWEIKQKSIVDMAIDRAPFVDQSQSLNIHMVNPTFAKLSTMHFHAWKGGLKTGMYYLRTQAAADAIKFTVDQSVAKKAKMRQQQKQEMQEVVKEISESTAAEANMSASETVTVTSTPAPAGAACRLKPKGMGDEEHCSMCSG